MTRRFILTGAPGAGKTALIHHFAALGLDVVEEAATEIIAREQATGNDRAWEHPGFITAIAALQLEREAAPMQGSLRFADRSLFCTLALAEWLGHPVPADLQARAQALAASGWFDRRAFFIDQLGFIENTAARRISFAEATRFSTLHETVYRRHGFELVHVAPAPVAERAATILAAA